MANDILEIEKGLFDENSTIEFKAKIHLEEYDSDRIPYKSENFLQKKDFLKGLFPIDNIKQLHTKFYDEENVPRLYSSDFSSPVISFSEFRFRLRADDYVGLS